MVQETEVFGVDYERYSLGKKLSKIVKKYKICDCLEIPAHGAKAMPSIYSFGMAKAGANLTLVNPLKSADISWKDAGLFEQIRYSYQENIHKTDFENDSFDMVWNFAYLPADSNPGELLQEMKRISRKYIMVFSVNGWNIGAFIHRFLHRYLKIPWTHGDVNLNFPKNVRNLMQKNGITILKTGVVDCPPWPDSLGFRDIRLHRQGSTEDEIDWISKTPLWTKNENYPLWIYLVYAFERIPMPLFIKYFYSHIFYVIGEKNE